MNNLVRYGSVLFLGIMIGIIGSMSLDDKCLFSSCSADNINRYAILGDFEYSKKKDYHKALELFVKANEVDPNDPGVLEFISKCYLKIGREDLSVEPMMRSLSLLRHSSNNNSQNKEQLEKDAHVLIDIWRDDKITPDERKEFLRIFPDVKTKWKDDKVENKNGKEEGRP